MAAVQDRWSERSEVLAAALARVALGDREAFATLYQASSAHLFGVILRINPDRAQAEDILQEVFVSIWQGARSFDAARSQPMTWLTSVARNRAIDSLRRRQTEPQTVSTTLGTDDDPDDMLQYQASDAPGPLELLARAGEAHALTACLGELSGEQQQSLALAFYQGLSHAEVAAHLRQPLGTVKSWLRRGLQALKACLERAAKAPAA